MIRIPVRRGEDKLGDIRRALARIRGGDIDGDVVGRLASETDTELCGLTRFIRIA